MSGIAMGWGRPKRSVSGLTLVELLMTVLLVSILASAVLPLAHLTHQRSKEAELRRSLREIRSAIDAYKRAVDEGRISMKPGESGYPRRLEDLVDGVPNAKVQGSPAIYFLRRIPPDPVQDEVGLNPAQSWGKRSYESSAENPKEGADVYDVYSRSTKVGANGSPYRDW